MNYEQLLDEIMVNTISAKELIGVPQVEVKYGVCPLDLEFHTSIFLAGALLAFDQSKPLVMLIQVEDLPEEVMVFRGQIGPHFGRVWDCGASKLLTHLPATEEKVYPYLDKLFAYLGVINSSQGHIVIFVKKGAKMQTLAQDLRTLLGEGYSLLVMSNAYQGLPSLQAKELSAELIEQCKRSAMKEDLEAQFPAFACLSALWAESSAEVVAEHVLNTGDMGMDQEYSTSLWCMLR